MRRLDQLTFKQLRALQAVAQSRSISGAAEAVNLTPPAVHSQLKTLEETFGCALLYRQGADAFRPTPEGEALLAAFREARAALERAIHQVASLNKGLSGSVVLGVVSTAKYFAPALVAQLRRALPDIDVVLKIGNREKILDALTARELDLVIMGRPPRAPLVEAKALGNHPHVIIAPPDHPLAQQAKLPPEALLLQHFVMREAGSGTRILCDHYLDELGLARDVAVTEMESNETIKQAVISGLGIALLSGHTVIEELRSGRLVTLDAPNMPILRQWFLVHRSDQTLTKVCQNVWEWICENAGQALPQIGR